MNKKIRKMIIESIIKNLKEINLNISDIEHTRTNSTYNVGHADRINSSRTGLASSSYKGDYYEDKDVSEEADVIQQAKDMKDKFDKQKADKDNMLNSLDNYEEKIKDVDTSIDEFSGVVAGGGGPATPLGTDATGKVETSQERKNRYQFNKTRSFPYSK